MTKYEYKLINKYIALLYSVIPKFLLRVFFEKLIKPKFSIETKYTQVPITFDLWYNQAIGGHCSSVYWPVHKSSLVLSPENIYCGIETSPGYMPGNYIQGFGKIYIGDYTQIGPNVGIISSNHSLEDNRKSIKLAVHIGKYSWLGFGCCVLPGVKLGPYTIVGAGSIVTKSFPKGYCVIAGNPAKIVKKLNPKECISHESEFKYNGYIKSSIFEDFRNKYLNI